MTEDIHNIRWKCLISEVQSLMSDFDKTKLGCLNQWRFSIISRSANENARLPFVSDDHLKIFQKIVLKFLESRIFGSSVWELNFWRWRLRVFFRIGVSEELFKGKCDLLHTFTTLVFMFEKLWNWNTTVIVKILLNLPTQLFTSYSQSFAKNKNIVTALFGISSINSKTNT